MYNFNIVNVRIDYPRQLQSIGTFLVGTSTVRVITDTWGLIFVQDYPSLAVITKNLTEKLEKEIATAIPSLKIDHPTLHIGFGINVDASKLLTYDTAKSTLSNFPYEQNIDIPDYYFYSGSKTPLVPKVYPFTIVSELKRVDPTISETYCDYSWSLTNIEDVRNSLGSGNIFNLDVGRDNVLYIGIFNTTNTSFPSFYDTRRLGLVIYDETTTLAIEGGVFSGSVGANIGFGNYTIYKFVLSSRDMNKFSDKTYFEFGFYDSTEVIGTVGAGANFKNLLFRNLKSNGWVAFFRDSNVRKAILPRLECLKTNSSGYTFNLVNADNSSSIIGVTTLSMGSYTNGSSNTLKLKLRVIGIDYSLKFSRSNPIGTIVNTVKQDFRINITNYYDADLLFQTQVLEIIPGVTKAVLISGTTYAVTDIDIEFKSTAKLASAIANLRSLIIQVSKGGTVLRSLTVSASVI